VLATTRGGPHEAALRALGVDVAVYGARPWNLPGLVAWLRAWIRRDAPDLVHTHLWLADFAAGAATLGMRGAPPLLSTHHNGGERLARWINRLYPRVYRRFAAVLPVSQAVAASLRARGVSRTLTPLPGASTPCDFGAADGSRAAAWPVPSPARSGEPPPLRVFTAARLSPEKRLDLLLAAAAQLSSVEVVIAGEGPLEAALRARIRALPGPRAAILPWQDDIRPWLRAADVAAVCSRTEGLSQFLLEAMALARPVIASAVGGNPELVRHGVEGILVPYGDLESLCAALQRLHAKPARREQLGAAARARFLQCFTAERMLEKLLVLYEEIARRPAARSLHRLR
jgi:glycosyltransferase involved in cell wall biosynthesis